MKRVAALTVLVSLSAFAGTELKLATGTISTINQPIMITESNVNRAEWIVQFKKPITESVKADLKKQGVVIYSYIPEDAFIVRASSAQMLRLSQNSGVQAVVPFEPRMKLSPTLGALGALTLPTRQTVIVSVFDQAERSVIEQTIQKISQNILIQKSAGSNFVITTERSNLPLIAAVEGVENIQPFNEIEPLHMVLGSTDDEPKAPVAGDYTDLTGYETGTKVMNMGAAWDMGLTGQNQIVGMADTGLDSGDVKTIHVDFANGAVKSGYAVGMFGRSWADPMGHGTHVAGSVLGRGAASGGLLKGAAYSAQMVAQGMWSPVLNNLSVPSNLAGMFSQAYNDGARLHTNSWGAAASFGAYDKMAATVDQVMFEKDDMLIIFAAGNSGVDKNRDGRIDPGSMATPGTSKNALTVGASENLVSVGGIQKKISELKPAPENWPVNPIADSKVSDNVDGVAMFSSRGPTNDGRIKPDIVAPGTNILSVRSQQAGASQLWGAYNNDYTFSGGTSMATPLTAGAAAIVRQYLIEKKGIANPSAALVKAYLLHTATDMFPGQYGTGATQELMTRRPNSDEGYGRVNMQEAVASSATYYIEQSAGVATGETQEFTYTVPAGATVQANIVWTDAPGSVNASKALVNDLDLSVSLPDSSYAAQPDKTNNHEITPSLNTHGGGVLRVTVNGANIPMGKNGKQPFALVVSVR